MSSPIPTPGLGVDTFGFSTHAYHATASRSGLARINALADTSVNIIGNDFQVTSGFSNLAAAYANGAALGNARLTSPSLRKYANYSIWPIDLAAEPASPTGFEYMGFYNPLPVTTGDLLRADGDNSANAEYDTVLIWLERNRRIPVTGEFFTLRLTGTQTLSAHAWTAGTVTPETTLEEGIYGIVGCAAESAGLIAARFIFPGVANACRPGCIGQDAAGDVMPLVFRHGRLGVWGMFDAAVQPQMEYLSVSADTTQTVYWDLVKLTVGAQSMQAAYPGFAITQAMGVSPAPLRLY